MKTFESLEAEALLLPKDKRLTLAHRILASVEPDTTAGIETEWEEEIRDRIKKYDADATIGIPGPQVFKELEKKLKG